MRDAMAGPDQPARAARRRWRALGLTVATVAATCATAVATTVPASASAQTLINDTFGGATTTANVVTLSNTAGLPCLTGGTDTSAVPIPGCPSAPEVPGALRLTDLGFQEATGAQYGTDVPTGEGLSISFDMAQYGGSGADGVSFLVARAPPAPTAL